MYKPFCDKLVDTFAKTGTSQCKFARETYIERRTIGNYMRGRTEPSITNLLEICKYFNISPNEILCWEEGNKHV